MRTAVLASGRGSNLQAIIEGWQQGRIPVQMVAVGSDQPQAPVLMRAAEAGIPNRSFPLGNYPDRRGQERAILSWLQELGVELLLLAGYMKVLSADFVEGAGFPILNIHPSLLPAFPGMHAQKQAVEYGVRYSGCTVHFVDAGLDNGPIILQAVVPVLADDTEDTLAARILEQEHKIYPLAVSLLSHSKIRRDGRKVTVINDYED